MLTADKAISGNLSIYNFCHDQRGKAGEFWSADFAEESVKVHEVRILNRQDGCGERLAEAKIEIDGVYFGSLPKDTITGK